MFERASDFHYVSDEVSDLDLSLELMPLRTGVTANGNEKQAIIAGKDLAFLRESITERKFAAAIGSNDDFVSFSRRLDDSPCDAFTSGGNLEKYALDESVSIPRVVYSDKRVGLWADLFNKASIPCVAVQQIPTADRVVHRARVLAAFDNQSKLNRFYTPNLSAARAATGMRVGAYDATVQVSVADTDSCYQNSENNIYPPSVTTSTESNSVRMKDGEIVALKRYESTSYEGVFNLYGHEGTPKGFVRNEWRSRCYTFAAKTGYDLYLLTPGSVNVAPGAKYRIVFHFEYWQRYGVDGYKDSKKNIAGSRIGFGYIIGDEVTAPKMGITFVPRSNAFTPEILSDIRRHYQGIDPALEGFLDASNVPNWYDLNPPYETDSNVWQVAKEFSRRYEEWIILKPLGYIVTLGNHTRWKS